MNENCAKHFHALLLKGAEMFVVKKLVAAATHFSEVIANPIVVSIHINSGYGVNLTLNDGSATPRLSFNHIIHTHDSLPDAEHYAALPEWEFVETSGRNVENGTPVALESFKAMSRDNARRPVRMSEIVCCPHPALAAKALCDPANLTASRTAAILGFFAMPHSIPQTRLNRNRFSMDERGFLLR